MDLFIIEYSRICLKLVNDRIKFFLLGKFGVIQQFNHVLVIEIVVIKILNFVKIQFNSNNCKHFPLHIFIYHMYMIIFKCTSTIFCLFLQF